MQETREHIKHVIDTMSALSPAERKRLFENFEKGDPDARERVRHEQRRRWFAGYMHENGLR